MIKLHKLYRLLFAYAVYVILQDQLVILSILFKKEDRQDEFVVFTTGSGSFSTSADNTKQYLAIRKYHHFGLHHRYDEDC